MNAPVLSRIASRPDVSHAEMANAIRFLAIDAVEKAKSGHPGMPMGMADVATVLFSRFLKFDPSDPAWPDRDRFVLSAGHGSMLLYALLHLTGYEGMTLDELRAFRQWGSKTPGHPEYGHTAGVETTTGPLGQGIATAVGMALAERLMNARFGDDFVDHHTYVIAGDGCLMEGLSHEAISLAGHLQLSRLIVLFDDNSISIDGATSLSCSDDQLARFRASGWSACRIDGHDPEAIAAAIERARENDRPSLIACRTLIGFGAPNRQGSEKAHGAPLGADEVAKTRDALNWPHAAVPDSGIHSRAMAQGWRPRARRPPKLDRANQALRCRDALAISRCPQSQSAVRLCRRDGAVARSLRRGAAEHRNPAGVAACDRRNCRGVAQSARRLRRSDPFQSDARQNASAGASPIASEAAIFTMASASTPWRRR